MDDGKIKVRRSNFKRTTCGFSAAVQPMTAGPGRDGPIEAEKPEAEKGRTGWERAHE